MGLFGGEGRGGGEWEVVTWHFNQKISTGNPTWLVCYSFIGQFHQIEGKRPRYKNSSSIQKLESVPFVKWIGWGGGGSSSSGSSGSFRASGSLVAVLLSLECPALSKHKFVDCHTHTHSSLAETSFQRATSTMEIFLLYIYINKYKRRKRRRRRRRDKMAAGHSSAISSSLPNKWV